MRRAPAELGQPQSCQGRLQAESPPDAVRAGQGRCQPGGPDNPMKRSSGERDETPSRPITFRAAENLGAFELAQLWADRTAWPIDERTQYDELSELAVMSALGAWLRRWQPIAIHSAMLAGACPEAIMGAPSNSLHAVYERWHEWAARQRDLITSGRPGITAEEFDAVARRFAAHGVRRNDLDGEGSDLPNRR
jgi:hypothetical protein